MSGPVSFGYQNVGFGAGSAAPLITVDYLVIAGGGWWEVLTSVQQWWCRSYRASFNSEHQVVVAHQKQH